MNWVPLLHRYVINRDGHELTHKGKFVANFVRFLIREVYGRSIVTDVQQLSSSSWCFVNVQTDCLLLIKVFPRLQKNRARRVLQPWKQLAQGSLYIHFWAWTCQLPQTTLLGASSMGGSNSYLPQSTLHITWRTCRGASEGTPLSLIFLASTGSIFYTPEPAEPINLISLENIFQGNLLGRGGITPSIEFGLSPNL